MKSILRIALPAILWGAYAVNIHAQEHPTATGGEGTGTGGSFSYSIGEVDYIFAAGSNGDASQGVQQAYEIYSIGIDENTLPGIQANVYPNPATDVITLTITDLPEGNWSWSLIDMNGKMIRSISLQTQNTVIDMYELRQGEYILHINADNKKIKSFKIIKNQ